MIFVSHTRYWNSSRHSRALADIPTAPGSRSVVVCTGPSDLPALLDCKALTPLPKFGEFDTTAGSFDPADSDSFTLSFSPYQNGQILFQTCESAPYRRQTPALMASGRLVDSFYCAGYADNSNTVFQLSKTPASNQVCYDSFKVNPSTYTVQGSSDHCESSKRRQQVLIGVGRHGSIPKLAHLPCK